MHCIYCGTRLPDVADYCSKCGKPIHLSVQSDDSTRSVEVNSCGQQKEAARSVVGATTEHAMASYKWALVYGWFFVLTAVYLLVAGILTLVAGFEATPRPSLGADRPIGPVVAIGEGALFLVTGLAILKKRIVAITLVWVTTILAAFGVISRGVIPLDVITWLLTVWLARWFSKKRPLLVR